MYVFSPLLTGSVWIPASRLVVRYMFGRGQKQRNQTKHYTLENNLNKYVEETF